MSASAEKRSANVQRLLQEAAILRRNESFDEAEQRYRSILRLQPAHPACLNLLGGLLAQRGRYKEAAQLLSRACALEPRDADAQYNLGIALQQLNRHAEAIDCLRASLAIRSTAADAFVHLGISLSALGRHEEAVAGYAQAIAHDPACAAAYNNMGNALQALGRRGEALGHYEKALAMDPGYALAQENLGNALKALGRYREALESYRSAVAIRAGQIGAQDDVESARAFDNYLLTLNYCEEYDERALFQEHRRFGERFAHPGPPPLLNTSWPRRLRIGYVSPDFRAHSVSSFIEPVLARHDRSRVQIFCYDDCPAGDEVNRRLRGLAEHWIECAALPDAELAKRIRADRIDILIDLAGHTGGNRLLVFAQKPAPLQLSYLGYPGTIGLPAIDYRITDARADPPGDAERSSVEQLLRPWPSYFCYRAPATGAEPAPRAPAASRHITFGCFNNLPKLSDTMLGAAGRILAGVPGSRLVLKSLGLGEPQAAEELGRRLKRAGVDLARVELRGWEARSEDHLRAYGSIDIALDSFPYNGATTTCEALWMGVPVVTLQGDRHAGRMGSSLLHAVGLGELVASDVDAYVRTGTSLAADRVALNALQSGLRERLLGSPIMDEAGFTRALEECYAEIWLRKLSAASAAPG